MKDHITKRESAFAQKMTVVGDPHRLRIVCVLSAKGKLCVTEVARALSIPVANTSHHLRSLCTAGIIDSTRVGKQICYTLSDDQFAQELKNFICKLKII